MDHEVNCNPTKITPSASKILSGIQTAVSASKFFNYTLIVLVLMSIENIDTISIIKIEKLHEI
jgi:hypothetical protein